MAVKTVIDISGVFFVPTGLISDQPGGLFLGPAQLYSLGLVFPRFAHYIMELGSRCVDITFVVLCLLVHVEGLFLEEA